MLGKGFCPPKTGIIELLPVFATVPLGSNIKAVEHLYKIQFPYILNKKYCKSSMPNSLTFDREYFSDVPDATLTF